MATMKTEVEVEVFCTCGDELDIQRIGDGTINVSPCDNCLKKKYDEGYDEGYAEGEEANKED